MSEVTLPSVVLNGEEITFSAYRELLSLMYEEMHHTRKEKIVSRHIDKEKVEETLPDKKGYTKESAKVTKILLREVDEISWELLEYGQSHALVGECADREATEWVVDNYSDEELLNNR